MKKILKSFSLFILILLIAFTNSTYVSNADGEIPIDIYEELKDNNYEVKKELEKTKEELKNLKDEEKAKKLNIDYETNFPNLIQNSTSDISLTLTNKGEVNINALEVELTSLPAGVSLKSGMSPQLSLGNFDIGSPVTAVYTINVAKTAESGNYPITFNIKGKYGLNSLKEYTTTKTFYLKIEKDNDRSSLKPVIISNIKHPSIINKGSIVDFNFDVTNPNSTALSSIKVTVTPEEGLVNQSQNVFVLNNLSAGEKRSLNVKLFAKNNAEKKNYSINVTAEDIGTYSDKDSNEKIPTASQYSGIFYNTANGTDNVKNPQIIITNYSYGKQNIIPGEEFTLNMSFLNTSKSATLRNIKISTAPEENTFIPVNSSNSFYIDSLEPNGTYQKSITFVTKADALTKTVPINIDYAYEDLEGNPLTAKETISVPVVQKTVFSVDEILKPYDVMEGEPVSINASFYNLGKTQISNLKITSSGSFTADGDPTYFVGNLDSGKSDSYSVSARPNDPNHIDGTILFTYETVDGQTHSLEKKFSFDLNPIPMDDSMNNEEVMPPEENKVSPLIIGGSILAVAVVGFVIYKKRKKKKESEFDLDE